MEETELYHCPNCEKQYAKSYQYCPHCGQKKEESILTFKEILTDFLGSLFSFDSKAVHSIPKLLFRPGRLTVDYLKGKRNSYLPPFKMYLFLSVVLFLLLPFVVNDDNIFKANEYFNEENIALADSIGQIIDSALIVENERNNRALIQINTGDSIGQKGWSNAVKMVEEGETPKAAVDSNFANLKPTAKFALKQALKLNSAKGNGLVGLFLNVVSYSLFIFLPLFSLLMHLLYFRKKRFYIEHFIFSLHIFSFIFIIFILLVLCNILNIYTPTIVGLILILVYLIFATKKVYQQSWIKTILKNILLLFSTFIFLVPLIFISAILVSIIFY